MDDFYNIYSDEIPEFLFEFATTTEMLRLKDIGMNCGCEYTSFTKFDDVKKYSRYTHSMGVAIIIWHFTNDIKQSVAGLLHDIATPVFAHTIDFLNGDHERQNSTESGTRQIIEGSRDIVKLLTKYNLEVDDVCDYHMYPIADNQSPRLSADRLEYSLGNMVNYGFCSLDEAKSFYDDIVVGTNEFGEKELIFQHEQPAVKFTENVLRNSRLYVSDEDRFAMQKLADIVKFAINERVLQMRDLHMTESYVIDKLVANPITKILWDKYCKFSNIEVSKYNLNLVDISIADKPKDLSDLNFDEAINVGAKRRYIDPLVKNKGRISRISNGIAVEIDDIKNLDFDVWIRNG